jgi:hypothetical protein
MRCETMSCDGNSTQIDAKYCEVNSNLSDLQFVQGNAVGLCEQKDANRNI